MDHTGKLPGGIIGVTICIILLMAAALPILNAMIDTVDKETTGPGQVTESGTNDIELTAPTFNYVDLSKITGVPPLWVIKKASTGYTLEYSIDQEQLGSSSADSFECIIPTDTEQYSGRIVADSAFITIEAQGTVYTYPSPNQGDNISVTFMNDGTRWIAYCETSFVDAGGTHILSYRYPGVSFFFVQHCDGMPAATHGYVSGNPESVMGDSLPNDRIFKLDAQASLSERLMIDVRDVIGSDQRRFMLDTGDVLDLDDTDSRIKTASKSETIPGSALKTSRSTVSTAIMLWDGGATNLMAAEDVSSEYTAAWGEFQAPRDLEVPMLETVSHSGSLVTGWYIPIEWTHTGTGTVTVKTMIYSVLSVIPLILVVALFILVVRWMQAESGVKETDALLGGGRPKYDGWRDRR